MAEPRDDTQPSPAGSMVGMRNPYGALPSADMFGAPEALKPKMVKTIKYGADGKEMAPAAPDPAQSVAAAAPAAAPPDPAPAAAKPAQLDNHWYHHHHTHHHAHHPRANAGQLSRMQARAAAAHAHQAPQQATPLDAIKQGVEAIGQGLQNFGNTISAALSPQSQAGTDAGNAAQQHARHNARTPVSKAIKQTGASVPGISGPSFGGV